MLRLKSRVLGPRLLGPDPYFFLRPPLRLRPARLRGTFPPARRASLRPIAIACLRLVTLFPDRPERSLPRFRSRIARSTFCDAFRPYFGMAHLKLRILQGACLNRHRSNARQPPLQTRTTWLSGSARQR